MSWDVSEACFPEVSGTGSGSSMKHTLCTQTFCDAFRTGHSRVQKVTAMLLGWTPAPVEKHLFLHALVPKLWDDSLGMSNACAQFTRSIRSLHLHMLGHPAELIPRPTGELRKFQALIGSMSKLEELGLLFQFGSSSPTIDLDNEDVIENTFIIKDLHWCRLRVLDLRGGWLVKSGDLLNFFRRHQDTLHHLSLGNFSLSRGSTSSWVDIAEKMREILPTLQTCHFFNLSELGYDSEHLNHLPDDGDYTKPVRDYDFRRRQLDILQRWVLGRMVGEQGSIEPLGQLEAVRSNWHNYGLMDRGPRMIEELDLRRRDLEFALTL